MFLLVVLRLKKMLNHQPRAVAQYYGMVDDFMVIKLWNSSLMLSA